MFRALLILLGLVLLAGCARAPVTPAPVAGWAQRRQALEALNHWELHGRIAIINRADSVNASLDWRQQGDRYALVMSGPFGQGRLQLDSDGREVTLSDGEHVMTAPDAETLLQNLGLHLPLNGLHHWIRGLPQPDMAAKMVQDDGGRLVSLQQAGWDIRFLRYRQVQGLDLPAKIFLEGHDYKVRVLVHDWRLPPPDPFGRGERAEGAG